MKRRQKAEDPWQYGTFNGAERLQHQQTARMTFSERLQALDDMIILAGDLHASRRNLPDILRFPKPSDEM